MALRVEFGIFGVQLQNQCYMALFITRVPNIVSHVINCPCSKYCHRYYSSLEKKVNAHLT